MTSRIGHRTGGTIPHMRHAWPLVGRQAELEHLRASLRYGSAGTVVAGAAGVGKTRLARELVASLADDFAVEWIGVTPASAAIPLGPMAHLLPPAVSPGQTERLERLRQATAALTRRSGDRRLVVVVDDAHLLDDSSAAVIHRVALQGDAFVVVTVRSGEPAPEPITALWKDGIVDRVELRALSAHDVHELVAVALPGAVDDRVHQALWRSSHGNALLLREVVLDAVDTGRLDDAGDRWSWSGDVHPGARLRDLVGQRLASVAPAAHRILDLLALSEPALPSLLGDPVEVAEHVAVLEDRDLVSSEVEGDETVVRLAHPLYGEVLRAAMTPLQLRSHEALLADRLERTGMRRRGDTLRVAAGRLRAGIPVLPELAVRAAREALAVFDYDLAERLARIGLGTTSGVDAAVIMGRAWNETARHADAAALLDPVRHASMDDDQRTEVALELAEARLWSGADVSETVDLIEAAARATHDRGRRQELEASRLTVLAMSARVAEALAVGEPLLAAPDLSERALLRAVPAMVPTLVVLGRGHDALQLADRCIEVALRHTDDMPFGLAWAMEGRFIALYMLGRLDELDALLGPAYDIFEKRGDELRAHVGVLRGRVATNRGRLRDARTWLSDAAAVLRGLDAVRFLPWCLAAWAEAEALAGDAAAAARLVAEADAIPHPIRMYMVDVERARAWAAASAGELTRATAILRDYAAAALEGGLPSAEGLALHDCLRLGDSSAAPRLAEILVNTDGAWARAVEAHAGAVMCDSGDGFETATDQFEAMGAWMLAAETAVEAAARHSRRGLRSRAHAAEMRARELLTHTDGPRTPLLERLGSQLPLSRREHEVARLTARGLTSKEVADRLSVSVRTVETHLHAIYGKLGIRGRRELASIVERARREVPGV